MKKMSSAFVWAYLRSRKALSRLTADNVDEERADLYEAANPVQIELNKMGSSSRETPTTAFILSLIAGILMLVIGILSAAWFMTGGYAPNGPGMMGGSGMMDGFGGMMDGYESMMYGFGVPLGFMSGLSVIGLIAGIIVIIGAIMLSSHPADHITWGAIVLAFSVISLLGMGGFYVGALLGIAGGALAISWRPAART